MQARAIKILPVESMRDLEFTVTVDRNHQSVQHINDMARLLADDKELEIEIKQHRKRRSLDANSYCWILCDKIARAISNTKEYVYQEAIKSVGVFEILPIKDEALERWIQVWESKGVGWQCEVMRESKLDGYTTTKNYYGSSAYNTKEFSRLLEEIIYQAKELGIETMTPDERKQLISTWEGLM